MDTTSPTDTSEPNTMTQTETFYFGDDSVEVHIEDITQVEIHPKIHVESTHPQRDNGPSERTFEEQSGDPVAFGHSIDRCFALAVEEARLNSVSQISDGFHRCKPRMFYDR